MHAVARSGWDGGDRETGGNGGNDDQAKVSILSDAITKEAGEAVLKKDFDTAHSCFARLVLQPRYPISWS